jgi:hypothetical protein
MMLSSPAKQPGQYRLGAGQQPPFLHEHAEDRSSRVAAGSAVEAEIRVDRREAGAMVG